MVQLIKQPSKRSCKVKIEKQSFENSLMKDFAIPAFIDKYNHSMNHVDQADHIQAWLKTFSDHCLFKG